MVAPQDQQARLRAIIGRYVGYVSRTLLKAGVPQSELEDEIQRTFIAMAGRLEAVHVGAERNFLYQVAVNIAAHARRRFARRREVLTDQLPEGIPAIETPEGLAERKQMRQLIDDVADSMSESLRSVFTLYEIDGRTISEIAALLGVPGGTVSSRLRRARAHFRQQVMAVELGWQVPTRGGAQDEGPALLRRGDVSALVRALLVAGASAPRSAAMRAKTLIALGVS